MEGAMRKESRSPVPPHTPPGTSPASAPLLHPPFSQLALLTRDSMGPWAHAPTRADDAPGSRALEQVAETCPRLGPACEKPPGSGPRGGENDAPQRGRVPGEESLSVLGNSMAGPTPLTTPQPPPRTASARRGAHAYLGWRLPARESPPLTQGRRRGGGTRAPPLPEAETGTPFPLQ